MGQRRPIDIFKLWKDFSFEAAHQLTKVPIEYGLAELGWVEPKAES